MAPERNHSRAAERVRLLQRITVAWMCIETALSLRAAWQAHSPALLAFGGDSLVELLSAFVVLWAFASLEARQRVAGRITGLLLVTVAVATAFSVALSLRGYSEPEPSRLGIAVLLAAAIFMPLLSSRKRKLAEVTASAALRADAAQSALCAYFSLIALIGLALNALWQIAWADSVAAIAIIPFILREAWESIRGRSCACCSIT